MIQNIYKYIIASNLDTKSQTGELGSLKVNKGLSLTDLRRKRLIIQRRLKDTDIVQKRLISLTTEAVMHTDLLIVQSDLWHLHLKYHSDKFHFKILPLREYKIRNCK